MLSVLLGIAIALAFASFLHGERWAGFGAMYLLNVANQQSQAQQLAKEANEAVRANEAAFGRLAGLRDAVQVGFDELKQGDPKSGLPPSPPDVAAQLRNAEAAWVAVRDSTDKILAAKQGILQVPTKVEETRSLLVELSKAMDEIAKMMVAKKQAAARVLVAAGMVVPVERMFRALGELLAGGAATQDAIDRGLDAAQQFSNGLDALKDGDPELGLEPEKDPQLQRGTRSRRQDIPENDGKCPVADGSGADCGSGFGGTCADCC